MERKDVSRVIKQEGIAMWVAGVALATNEICLADIVVTSNFWGKPPDPPNEFLLGHLIIWLANPIFNILSIP